MKRTADEAALSMAPENPRERHRAPGSDYKQSRDAFSPLDCDSTFTVDSVKRTLIHQMYITLGQCQRISSFQLQHGGHHVAFTQPITALSTLLPLQFVRTAPDQ